jgi:hypothetical protein
MVNLALHTLDQPRAENSYHAIQARGIFATHVLEHPAAMRYNLVDIRQRGFPDCDFVCQDAVLPVHIGLAIYVNLTCGASQGNQQSSWDCWRLEK